MFLNQKIIEAAKKYPTFYEYRKLHVWVFTKRKVFRLKIFRVCLRHLNYCFPVVILFVTYLQGSVFLWYDLCLLWHRYTNLGYTHVLVYVVLIVTFCFWLLKCHFLWIWFNYFKHYSQLNYFNQLKSDTSPQRF